MHYVLRTDAVLLKPPKSQEIELCRLAEQSSPLWNAANYERRQAYFKHHKIPTYHEQCKTLRHSEYFKAIGTGKGQALLKKLQEAWNSLHLSDCKDKESFRPTSRRCVYRAIGRTG